MMIIPILEAVKFEEGSGLGWFANGCPTISTPSSESEAPKLYSLPTKGFGCLSFFVRPAIVVEGFLLVYLLILLLFLVILCVTTIREEMIVITTFVAKPLDNLAILDTMTLLVELAKIPCHESF